MRAGTKVAGQSDAGAGIIADDIEIGVVNANSAIQYYRSGVFYECRVLSRLLLTALKVVSRLPSLL